MRISILIVFILLLNLCYSQSKKKQIEALNYRVDSLRNVVNFNLNHISNLEKIKGENEALVNSLSIEISENKSKIADLRNQFKLKSDELLSEKESKKYLQKIIDSDNIQIKKLNELVAAFSDSLKIYLDSLKKIDSIYPAEDQINKFSKNDFLNNYFFNQIPLNNNSFKLKLEKMVFGSINSKNDNSYDYNSENPNSFNIPEILNLNQFQFYRIKPNTEIQFKPEPDFNRLVEEVNSEFFNSFLPRMEFLKNKLLTIKYFDETEENFLFNVGQESKNNFRRSLQIFLVNEKINNFNDEKISDIVLTLVTLENECYLAMNYEQILRFKVPLYLHGDVQYFNKKTRYHDSRAEILETGRVYLYGSNYWFNDSGPYVTTYNKDVYLGRKKDLFMNNGYYVNPKELIFLFKLE